MILGPKQLSGKFDEVLPESAFYIAVKKKKKRKKKEKKNVK